LARRIATTQSNICCALGVFDAGLGHLAFQVQVTQHRLPALGQRKAHPQDERAARQAQAIRAARADGGVLEHRIAVAKAALRRIQGEQLAGEQVDGVQRMKAVLQLHPISTDVLHRRCAHGAGNQGQVFQAGVAVVQRPCDQGVPVDAGARLDHPVFVGLCRQAHARHLDFEHQRLDVTGEHNVAAAAQHLAWQSGQSGGRPARRSRSASQRMRTNCHRLGCDAKGVVRLQGDVFLQVHGRIVAFSTSGTFTAMPSFDTVCEPNMAEVRNAVDTSAKEIGTRFDFKGTSAKIELKDKEITMFGDAEFQLTQVEDILRNKLTKRNVDVRFSGHRQGRENRRRQGQAGDQGEKRHRAPKTPRRSTKLIKESKIKVQASIQGDAVRVTGAKRDDLQEAMALLRKDMTELPLSFDNFRD
jgi:cyclic-di-GMP-binding protein